MMAWFFFFLNDAGYLDPTSETLYFSLELIPGYLNLCILINCTNCKPVTARHGMIPRDIIKY